MGRTKCCCKFRSENAIKEIAKACKNNRMLTIRRQHVTGPDTNNLQ